MPDNPSIQRALDKARARVGTGASRSIPHENPDGTPRLRSEIVTDAVLGAIADAGWLVPGAAAELREEMARRKGGAHELIPELFARLLTPAGRKYLDPEAKREGHPLKLILGVLPITEDARTALWDLLALPANAAMDTAGRVAALREAASKAGAPFDANKAEAEAASDAVRDVAALVLAHLESPEGRWDWSRSVQPRPSQGEQTARHLIDVLAQLGYVSPDADRDLLAHRAAGRGIHHKPTADALREMLGFLGTIPGAAGPTPRHEFDAADAARWMRGEDSTIGGPAPRVAAGTPPRRPVGSGSNARPVDPIERAAEQLRQSGRYAKF